MLKKFSKKKAICHQLFTTINTLKHLNNHRIFQVNKNYKCREKIKSMIKSQHMYEMFFTTSAMTISINTKQEAENSQTSAAFSKSDDTLQD